MQVVEKKAVDALNLGAVKYGFYCGNLALSSREASFPEVSALDVPALFPLSLVQTKVLMYGEEIVF